MKRCALPILAVLAVACAEAAPEPLSPDIDALVASAPEWTAAGITQELALDDALRGQIETRLASLHASLLELHARHDDIDGLEGAAREAALADLHEAAASLRGRHDELWEGLDHDVAESLRTRLHDRMHGAHESSGESLHDRMRRLHGPGSAEAKRGH